MRFLWQASFDWLNKTSITEIIVKTNKIKLTLTINQSSYSITAENAVAEETCAQAESSQKKSSTLLDKILMFYEFASLAHFICKIVEWWNGI